MATTAHRASSGIYRDLFHSQSLVKTDHSHALQPLVMGKPGANASCEANEPEKSLHVAVIGAGLAGLRCADILLQHGFRVTLIEGRDRLGGRVAQERLPNGHLVDLGPNWIHGTDGNPILDLVKATGTAVGTWDESSHMFDENGNLFARQESERYSQIMWKMIQEAFEYSNIRCPDIPAEESLLDFFRRKLPEHIPDTEPGHLKDRAFVLQLAESWGAFVGSPVSTQSLRFFWLEECIDGETLFCADTYRKILTTVARPAQEKATIMLGTKITRFDIRTSGSSRPRVHTEEGQTLEFDEVVCTAPLGWLKKNLDAFHPSLPDRLQQGIAAIGYGCLEKVYISFPQPFWLTPDKTGRVLQGFCQWLTPKYALESNPTCWSQETVELASPSLGTSHPTLLFYIFGNESRFITQQVGSLGTKQQRDDFLRSFFKPYYSRLPQYDESSADCLPTAFLSTDWLHDDLAGNGSYCNFQTGLARGDDDIRAMREGLPEGGLWLAGEHTAPFVALGTATGAYWSGENVGRRIAEMHGRGRRA
ncbi:hypothetical protein BN1723_014658 [Verticillium longisporum]|uniref:Amine oxidase domain-containing protein n=1 Tax=Verticillium longisporum TaxID=100787 RepID=A0A0G4MEI1_VERLO|nr:hypothetical protein BN1723_014658 [Verticillium longisporum]